MLFRLMKNRRKGQAMVEYALLVACVFIVGAVAFSMLGHKTADTAGIAAAIMPGAHTDDNNPINTSQVIGTKLDTNGDIVIDSSSLLQQDRFAPVLGGSGASLVIK
jgi:Flp pilus assembly pilin Flp